MPRSSPPSFAPISLQSARLKAGSAPGVPSPCVGVCKMQADTGWCSGCYRSIEEITAWSRASDATKLALWAVIEQRQADVLAALSVGEAATP